MQMNDNLEMEFDGRKCLICGSDIGFEKSSASMTLFREMKCKECHGTYRNNAIAFGLLQYLYGHDAEKHCLRESIVLINKKGLSIYENCASGSIHEELKKVDKYVCSEFFDEDNRDEYYKNVRFENLESLSFGDKIFDIVITQDVLEHVQDYKKAFLEINRVLKYDGLHIFTIPYHEQIKTSSRINDDGYIAQPVFHGDSLRKNGIIVYTDFGFDLPEKLRLSGFNTDVITLNKWFKKDEISLINTDDEYQNYLKYTSDLLNYFKYNNNVFISKKIKHMHAHLNFTGERMIPVHNEKQDIYLEHIVRYIFAEQFVGGKIVLDIACGSGYGSDSLVKSGAKKVIGVDVSEEAIAYCEKAYSNENLTFLVGSVEKIPLEDASVDVIISFETIEHVSEDVQKFFLSEVKRVLRKDGTFIVSTPNTKVFPKGNDFHIHELERAEFNDLLRMHFSQIQMQYQDDFVMSCVVDEAMLKETGSIKNSDIVLKKLESFKQEEMQFFVAVCSNSQINIEKNYLAFSAIRPWMAYKWYEGRIKMNECELAEKNLNIQNLMQEISRINQERDQEISRIKSSKFWKLRNIYLKIKGFWR